MTEGNQPSTAEAAVRLRARPPSPKRLSRKVLLVGAGTIGAVIAAALVTGLSPRPVAAASRADSVPPPATALPEGLSRLPARYETDALAPPAREASEPYDWLWGAGGPPEHLYTDYDDHDLALPEASNWRTDDPHDPASSPPPRQDAPPALFFARRELPPLVRQAAPPVDLAGKAPRGSPDPAYLTASPGPPPGPPYLLQAGSVIPASLLTAVNSDLPGRVIAQVSVPVYDSVIGDHLLIPQGARIIGTYSSQASYGDSRVFLSWDRLLMPDGSSLDLPQMAATDAAGSAGLDARVDNRLGRVGGAIAISAVLSILANEAENTSDGRFTRSLGDAAAQEAARTGSRIVGRELNLRPTLRVPAGAPVRVLVTDDILLKPYTE